MIHPYLKHFLQAHGVWATVDQRHVIDGEIVLQRCVLEQLRQYGVRVEAGFDFNDKASAVMAVRQIDRARNTLQLAIFTPSEIRSNTRSGPTMNGSSVTTMAFLRAVTFSICVTERVVNAPRPVS